MSALTTFVFRVRDKLVMMLLSLGSAGRREELADKFPTYDELIFQLPPVALRALDEARGMPQVARQELAKLFFSLQGEKAAVNSLVEWTNSLPWKRRKVIALATGDALLKGDTLPEWFATLDPKVLERLTLVAWAALANEPEFAMNKRMLVDILAKVPASDCIPAILSILERLSESEKATVAESEIGRAHV